MNSYSLAADSRRWWWLPAAAGAIGTAAVAAILVVPATGTASLLEPPSSGVGGAGSGTIVERPCYLARPEWNTVRGSEHPVCTTGIGTRDDGAASYARRPAPDYLP
jgi:hypothetical protein